MSKSIGINNNKKTGLTEIKLLYTLYPIIRMLLHRDLKSIVEIGDVIYMSEMLEINSYGLFRRDLVDVEVNKYCEKTYFQVRDTETKLS